MSILTARSNMIGLLSSMAMLLLPLLCCPAAVEGMAELTEEMRTARNLQDLLEAERKLHGHSSGADQRSESIRLRKRMLAGHGLVDSEPILADSFGGEPGFYHGVASGDPMPDAVIVWTRYTPESKDESIELDFCMAMVDSSLALDDHLDPEKNEDLHRAKVTVDVDSDFIAKIDVKGLKAGASYVFAFADENGKVSPIGQTKTAPGPDDDVESMVYAVFSCAHFANGYFHAYDVASAIKDLDFWIHTGDYVYEYGLFSGYASDSAERKAQILPVWEQISLQDHRNRMATYHLDKGLQNLRRRAPLIACWDDHESTNNPFGQGTPETTGAENHQEVCPANATSPDAEKSAAGCDRDEGDVVTRFNAAAQSYLEWMPIRRHPGNMGVIDVGSILQVISWGDMATIVTFDTRISHRSEDPTIGGSTWGAFFPFATVNTDVSQYSNESSPLHSEVNAVAAGVAEVLESDEFTMIGDDIEFLKTNFAKSKRAGQPWQIWNTATPMGRAVKGDFSTMHKTVQDPAAAAVVKATTDAIYGAEASTFFRALTAQAVTSTPWNRDDYGGFAHEQRLTLDVLKENTNNPIILAGDLHDSYAWTLYEDGAVDGTPAAVNLVAQGVTSPGWGPFLFPAFQSLSETVGGDDELYDLLEKADEDANPGLKYFNMQHKGFFAVKATKESHVVAEYFVFTPEAILTNYAEARDASGEIVANFACDTQLTTKADEPGSLDRVDSCSDIEFESERPAVWDLAFPVAKDEEADSTKLMECGYKGCDFDVADAEEACTVSVIMTNRDQPADQFISNDGTTCLQVHCNGLLKVRENTGGDCSGDILWTSECECDDRRCLAGHGAAANSCAHDYVAKLQGDGQFLVLPKNDNSNHGSKVWKANRRCNDSPDDPCDDEETYAVVRNGCENDEIQVWDCSDDSCNVFLHKIWSDSMNSDKCCMQGTFNCRI